MEIKVTLEQMIEKLVYVRKNLSPAVQESLRGWYKDEFPKRFSFGNTQKYGWTPNTAKYEKWKLRKYGPLPQLVLSGKLKQMATKSGRVSYRGLRLNVPSYAKYQRDLGRDFMRLTPKEKRQIVYNSKKIMRKFML
jgi:hypothetical protein